MDLDPNSTATHVDETQHTVEALKKAIRSKPAWTRKVGDADISRKYILEAVAQGVPEDIAREVLLELQTEAAALSSEASNSGHGRKPAYRVPSLSPAEWKELEKQVVDARKRVSDSIDAPLVRIWKEDRERFPALTKDSNLSRDCEDQEEELVYIIEKICDGCKKYLAFGRPLFRCSMCNTDRWRTAEFCDKCFAKIAQFHDASHEFRRIELPELESFAPIVRELKTLARNELRPYRGHKVLTADSIIPECLRSLLVRHLDALADAPNKDFHPGAKGKVLDLIHPSLYPFIRGESHVRNPKQIPDISHMTSNRLWHGRGGYTTKAADTSKYQWLPAEVDVDKDGNAKFASYINNLDRETHNELYRVLAEVLSLCLPMFERTLGEDKEEEAKENNEEAQNRRLAQPSSRFSAAASDSTAAANNAVFTFGSSDPCGFSFEIPEVEQLTLSEPPDSPKREKNECEKVSLRNRRIQVIVKAANYILKPGQSYTGSWHMEGMVHERIVASAIYYYESSPLIEDQGLSFRRMRDDDGDDWPRHDSDIYDLVNERVDEVLEKLGFEIDGDKDGDVLDDIRDGIRKQSGDVDGTVDFGTVKTPEHRVLVFPNDPLQHCVAGLKNIAPGEEIPNEKPRIEESDGEKENTDNESQTEPEDYSEHPLSATRKILCFFLIDPDNRIASTADVPEQQWERLMPQIAKIIDAACMKHLERTLPVELMLEIFKRAKWGMTHAEALAHRLALMKERKFFVNDLNEIWERDYSLCEH